MKSFALILQDATRTQAFPTITAFSGSDRSGSFSLWAGHERFMTELIFGLARFQVAADISEEKWCYLALPGALLYFCDNTLTLSTRRFLCSDSYEDINTALREQLLAEEENLHNVKTSLRQMEDAVLKRLYELNQRAS